MIRRLLAAIATRIANWADPDRYVCAIPNATNEDEDDQ